MRPQWLPRASSILVGVVVGVVHLYASFTAFAVADSIAAPPWWAFPLNDLLSFPLRTVDVWMTHGAGSDLFLWEFPLNALLWGVAAAGVWSRTRQKSNPQSDRASLIAYYRQYADIIDNYVASFTPNYVDRRDIAPYAWDDWMHDPHEDPLVSEVQSECARISMEYLNAPATRQEGYVMLSKLPERLRQAASALEAHVEQSDFQS